MKKGSIGKKKKKIEKEGEPERDNGSGSASNEKGGGTEQTGKESRSVTEAITRTRKTKTNKQANGAEQRESFKIHRKKNKKECHKGKKHFRGREMGKYKRGEINRELGRKRTGKKGKAAEGTRMSTPKCYSL